MSERRLESVGALVARMSLQCASVSGVIAHIEADRLAVVQATIEWIREHRNQPQFMTATFVAPERILAALTQPRRDGGAS